MALALQTADRGNVQDFMSAQDQQVPQETFDSWWDYYGLTEGLAGMMIAPQIDNPHEQAHPNFHLAPFFSDSRKKWVKAVTDLVMAMLSDPSEQEEADRDPVEEKLNRIAGFSSGWHFGEGVPFPVAVLRQTRQLHQLGKVLSLEADVFPHEDGDVSIMFKSGNQYLEILSQPGERFSFTLEEGTKHPFTLMERKEDVSFSDVVGKLLTFARSESVWDYCDSFTLTNTATSIADLPLNVFATLHAEPMERRWKRGNAGLAYLTPNAYMSALQSNIFVDTFRKNMATLTSSANPSISGFSPLYPTA